MLYVRWCSACVEGAFKYKIIACAGSTQIITTQTRRVYISCFTRVQSVTSALQTWIIKLPGYETAIDLLVIVSQ